MRYLALSLLLLFVGLLCLSQRTSAYWQSRSQVSVGGPAPARNGAVVMGLPFPVYVSGTTTLQSIIQGGAYLNEN